MSPQKKRSCSLFSFIEADFRVIVFSGQPFSVDQTPALSVLNAVASEGQISILTDNHNHVIQNYFFEIYLTLNVPQLIHHQYFILM